MNIQDQLWNLSIEETEEGIIFCPYKSCSYGYIISEDKLEKTKNFFKRAYIVFCIFLFSNFALLIDNFIVCLTIAILLWISFNLITISYIKRYGTKINRKFK